MNEEGDKKIMKKFHKLSVSSILVAETNILKTKGFLEFMKKKQKHKKREK